jgi:hypothetical protein
MAAKILTLSFMVDGKDDFPSAGKICTIPQMTILNRIANPNGRSKSKSDVRLELILQRDKTVYAAARIGSRKPNLLSNFMLDFLLLLFFAPAI